MRSTVHLAIAPLFPFVFAAALRAQTPPPITHERVSVAATNDEWTPTNTTVAVGDLLVVEAEGRIAIGRVLGEIGPAFVTRTRSIRQGFGSGQLSAFLRRNGAIKVTP